MKTRVPIFALLMMLLLTNTVYAQETRMNTTLATVSFSGTTATCIVDIVSNGGNDKISATIELLCGNQSIKTWNKSVDNGHLVFYDTVSVTKGKTYDLVVEYTVNGKTQSSFSGSGTCK